MKDIDADLLIANVEIKQLKAERDTLQKEVLKHRAKQYQCVNYYALEQAVCVLIRKVQALVEKLNTEQEITDYHALAEKLNEKLNTERKISDSLRSPLQKWDWRP